MDKALVHLGYTLMLCALAARDILWLRGTLVVAQSVLALYAARVGVPSIAAWNVVFVVLNAVWAVKIIRERRAVALPADLQPIHARHFFALPPREFLKLWQRGRRETVHDARLTRQGQFPDALYFVLAGHVRVTRDGAAIADLGPGHFVGEMSAITRRPATADAVATGEVEVMRWPRAELAAIEARDPAAWARIQSAIGHDLVVKIQRSAPGQAPGRVEAVPEVT